MTKATTISAATGGSALRKFGLNIAFFKSFFATWLKKTDLTTLAAALTIFSTLSDSARMVKSLAMKLYWYFTKFFTASISVAPKDKLNQEIVNWMGQQVLTRQGTRILTACTETIQSNDYWSRKAKTERNDLIQDKRVPIQYLPTFGTTWFMFEGQVFMIKRISSHIGVNEYTAAPKGNEPLVVMVLGRSVLPIKRFLDHCRDFAEKQREAFITVHASKGENHYGGEPWDTIILRPIRPIGTVHFDETTKSELVADIEKYLEPETRRFYTTRGIPYRRGYLLHGTPGTGKTSLSLALAGLFGLDLYLLHIPSVRQDSDLERMFSGLPPRCIVLLEDIDAVGMKRQAAAIDLKKDKDGKVEAGEEDESEDESEDEDDKSGSRSHCTLSGLLNVLDGVTSQEGRIVIMTTNHANKLDRALVRPGRIDKMILLDNISARSAELMFLRMFAPDESAPLGPTGLGDGFLEKLALEFSSCIPDNTLTPAQCQGYLLNHRDSAQTAAKEVKEWVADEKQKMEEAKQLAKQLAQRKKNKKKEKALKALTKGLEKLTDMEEEAVAVPKKTEDSDKEGKVEKQQKTGVPKNGQDVPNSKEAKPGEKSDAARSDESSTVKETVTSATEQSEIGVTEEKATDEVRMPEKIE